MSRLLGLADHMLGLSLHQAGLEREGQHLPQAVDLLLDAANMVGDVAKERVHGRVRSRRSAAVEPAANLHQRHAALRRRSRSRRSR